MTKRGTNPLGPGTKNVTFNVPERMQRELKALADASGMTFSEYVRTILKENIDEQAVYETVKVKRKKRN